MPRVRAARPVLKTRVLRGHGAAARHCGTWHRPGSAPGTGTSRPVGRAIDKNWDPERGSAAARQWRHPCAKDCGLRHYKSDAIVSAPFFFQNLFFPLPGGPPVCKVRSRFRRGRTGGGTLVFLHPRKRSLRRDVVSERNREFAASYRERAPVFFRCFVTTRAARFPSWFGHFRQIEVRSHSAIK